MDPREVLSSAAAVAAAEQGSASASGFLRAHDYGTCLRAMSEVFKFSESRKVCRSTISILVVKYTLDTSLLSRIRGLGDHKSVASR